MLSRKPSHPPPLSIHSASASSSSAPRTSMDSAADSGYASGSSAGWLSPHPDWVLSRSYENWKVTDAASQRLLVDMRALATCSSQLRAARKQRAQAQEPKSASRRPSLLPMPFRRRTVDSHPAASAAPPSSFPAAGPSSELLPSVEELEEQLAVLQQRVDSTQSAAVRLDAFFDELRHVLDDGRPASSRLSLSTTSSDGQPCSPVDEYKRVRKAVANHDQAYLDSKATTQALQHACSAIQSAHHHYYKAMQLLDAVCSPKKSRWEAIVGDEQSRQVTYREAAEWAHKAQLCFNECIKSLRPHWELLKRDEVDIFEELESAKLLQAVQLYNLMYGGRVLAMGITKEVSVMLQKQEAVFERLTRFAVFVQNCTEHCESVELDAHERRDAARRELVALWVRADEETERYSLAAPSEHSHVFSFQR